MNYTINKTSHNIYINNELVVDSNDFHIDSLKNFINLMNLDHPDIVYAQAKLESGNFKSNIFIKNNNLFGMKNPTIRNNLSIGKKNGYAYYKNWRHSVIDYALYQSTYLNDKSRNEYLKYIKDNYAKDPNYINKLNNILNE